jgi:hypothetical protein
MLLIKLIRIKYLHDVIALTTLPLIRHIINYMFHVLTLTHFYVLFANMLFIMYYIVDVSGSMGGDASIAGAENSGLSLLDITKHALKTVITSLHNNDRLSLVSYSNNAKVVCGLTPMTATGKARVLTLVDTLRAGGMTNLWDGLKKGLDTLTEASSVSSAASGVRNATVFLLTGMYE